MGKTITIILDLVLSFKVLINDLIEVATEKIYYSWTYTL
jgi:hypothetical protein